MDWHVTIWLFYTLARKQNAHVAEYYDHLGYNVPF